MTVLCTNSGVTYADIASAIAGESGNVYLDRKEYIQSGMSTAAAEFTPVDHPLSFLYTAADGELVTSGDINSGAGTNSAIKSTVDGGEITGVRTGALIVLNSNNAKLRRVIVNAGNGSTDGIAFNDTLDAEDVLIHNCNDGFLSSLVRLNSSIVRCTVIGATRFGYAQGKFTDCVDVNSSNQGYFNESAGSSGTWENDGTGTDTITESPATDIFVDYAAGDYSIKADTSVGLAGAFNQTGSTPTPDTVDLVFNDSEVNPSSELLAIKNIATIDLSNTETQVTSDKVVIIPMTQLSFFDSTTNITSDSALLANILQLQLLNSSVQLSSDDLNLKNVSALSLSGTLIQPTSDSVTIENSGLLFFSDSIIQPTSDTLAIELYTNLEFTSSLVQIQSQELHVTTQIMPSFGNNDLMLIDNTISYSLTDNTNDYRIK